MDQQEGKDCGYDGGEKEDEVASIYKRRTSLNQTFQIEFSKVKVSTSQCPSPYDLDDEVFIDFEDWQGSKSLTQGQIMSEEIRITGSRTRRTSDVIDCLGPDWTESFDQNPRSRRTTSPDLRETLLQPLTPRSDGYWSGSMTSVSSPLEPKWFRFSQCSSAPSESGSNFAAMCDSNEPSESGLRPRLSTAGEGENVVSSASRSDTVDAGVSIVPNNMPPPPERSRIEIQETLAPVHRDCYEYNMGFSRRGIAVIFNHEVFRTTSLPPRVGSKNDVDSLEKLYKTLGFEVRIYQDKTAREIDRILLALSREDHRDNDCVCVTVLTHGLDGDHLYAYDHPYPYQDLYHVFSADKCLSLAGKPKIFIFQACRGKKLDVGVRLVSYNTATDGSSNVSSYTIPTMADFLIVNSSFEGFYSWRNPQEGTWYIQSLVRILMEQHEQVDLMTMLTRVSCTVATTYESFDDVRSDLTGMKQAPSLISTLIRQVYFRPKP